MRKTASPRRLDSRTGSYNAAPDTRGRGSPRDEIARPTAALDKLAKEYTRVSHQSATVSRPQSSIATDGNKLGAQSVEAKVSAFRKRLAQVTGEMDKLGARRGGLIYGSFGLSRQVKPARGRRT